MAFLHSNLKGHNTAVFFIIVLLLFAKGAWAQEIQWASRLDYQFNQFQNDAWSGSRVLGKPDALPPGYLNKNAFRLRSRNEFGKIVVGFDRPQHAQQVVIVESFEPGRIVQVKVVDDKGFYYIIYQNKAYRAKEDFRTLCLSMPRTPYKIASVEITLNTLEATGYCQIDAVGLMDAAGLDAVRKHLPGANFNLRKELTFVSEKEILGESINTKYTEAKPLVSYDGGTVYFSRFNYPDNYNGKHDPQDIYFSTLLQGKWSEAVNIGAPLNDEYANGVCAIAPDGNSLLVINGYEKDGRISPGVSIAKRTALGWGKPKKVQIDGFKNVSRYQDFFLSADERVILMAIENDLSYGEQDLYVSFKIGYNHYSKPVNLGPQINTSKAEFAPFLSKDNKTLYFSTEGHGGFGMSDIYVANRLDNSWGNWSKPRNIGPNINTSSWEGYFSITDEGDYAYFVSSEGNRRDAENIYRIPLLKDVEQPDNHLQVAVKGRVFNVRNKKPLFAEVHLLSGDGENVLALSDAIEGHYELPVSHDGTYTLQVKARGFISYEEEIDIKVFEQQDVYLDVFLTPIEVGQVFALNKLYFHQGKPELLNASFPELQKLVQVLQENPGMVIELAGHTDRLGNRDLNKELSFDRVENIKGHLVEAGIDRARIETIGYGSAHPVAPSDTEENRRKNRRVEIKILQVAESF